MDLENIDMTVEISKGTNIKYEVEKDTGMLRCDRIINIPFSYPGNYGFIENTLSMDNDPIDILLINTIKLLPNTKIKVKILGVLLTEDEHGEDEKLIAVPDDSVDPSNSNLNDLSHINKNTLNSIEYFFTHYKDNDPNRWVNVKGFRNRSCALEILNKSFQRAQRAQRAKL